jgi:hypothetical protein
VASGEAGLFATWLACPLAHAWPGGLTGCGRGIQPVRSVEESVDDVCIYAAHLWAAWG